MAVETVTQETAVPIPQPLRHTKVRTVAFPNSRDVDRHVANLIDNLIRRNNEAGVPTVLGLATGSTPIGVYRELIRKHKEEGLDFSKVITFNLDEYYPMSPDSPHSYNRWMRETLFNHINIPEKNIHIPQGNLELDNVDKFCDDYEREIAQAGGIDLQILGIGRTGHIGFNEPGSPRDSRTRLVTLDPVTRKDASSSFYGDENVPMHAITMGVGSILAAKEIVMIAYGEHKAPIIRKAAEGEITDQITASFLQIHRNVTFYLDVASSVDLKAIRTPWLVGQVKWTPALEKRAVIWLSRTVQKPILKLEKKDFLEHHLHSLVQKYGSTSSIREMVFGELMRTICTKPGGHQQQTVIVFSPHPDDDVISMGGTLITLAQQGHDVYIAYMTSGNIAVFDHDAQRHMAFVDGFLKIFGLKNETSQQLLKELRASLHNKAPGQIDDERVLDIKALIRETEAVAGAITAGVPAEKCRFLDMPFYQTGQVTKKPIGEDDINIIANLLRELNPGQIYVAGDLSDPHGTHRMCAQAILKALDVVKVEHLEPEVWLYRGAWQEYEPHEIERAVPLSPELVMTKRQAIFKHESQKDAALFPGHDEREFWVRAEQRTRDTARIFNELGLPEYFALEGFVQYRGQL